jgi:serine phosphatase RsbU (regulator of sigma subunit)
MLHEREPVNARDVLVLYTDGVTDSFNGEEEEFGEQRLMNALRSHCTLRAEDLARAIAEEGLHFSGREQFDDITVITAKRAENRTMSNSLNGSIEYPGPRRLGTV